jgi:hypothetical protein
MSFISLQFFVERWQKMALLVFLALAYVLEKPNVPFVRLAFLH